MPLYLHLFTKLSQTLISIITRKFKDLFLNNFRVFHVIKNKNVVQNENYLAAGYDTFKIRQVCYLNFKCGNKLSF